MLDHVLATRYVSPLREGGSLPGLVEADDLGTYVAKFRGAGQGLKPLVAEVVVGSLARHLGLRVPRLVVIDLVEAIARYEADQEVQDLLNLSIGTNLGVDFLPGSLSFDGVGCQPDPEEATRVLWLDAFTANIDRTWRNPNLLVWHGELWCIDHGAALYFHHNWATSSPERFAHQSFAVAEHVFASYAPRLADAHPTLAARITDDVVVAALTAVPDDWLEPTEAHPSAEALRAWYASHLRARLASPAAWLPTAEVAR